MKVRIHSAATLLTCLFSTFAFADQPTPSFHGVWAGRIGEATVTACFNSEENSKEEYFIRTGRYYYNRHLSQIELGFQNKTSTDQKSIIVSENNGTWKINLVSTTLITGEWKNNKTSKTRPIRLSRITPSAEDANDDKTPCGSDAYNLPIENSVKKSISPILDENGIKYQIQTNYLPSSDHRSESIRLIGTTKAIKKINKSLQADDNYNFLACRRDAMNRTATEGSSHQDMGISVLGRWLTVKSTKGGDCRFGISIWSSTRIWDITTGEQENLFSWFKNISPSEKPRSEGNLPIGLDRFISSQFGKGDSNMHLSLKELERCYGEDQPGAYSYQINLTKDGIDFSIPETQNGSCGESIKLSYEELQRFFTQKGRKYSLEILSIQKKNQS